MISASGGAQCGPRRERAKKRASFGLYGIEHRAVAVNQWRGSVNNNIDNRCPVCPRCSEESVMHRFWECSAQRAWQWAIHVMNTLVEGILLCNETYFHLCQKKKKTNNLTSKASSFLCFHHTHRGPEKSIMGLTKSII